MRARRIVWVKEKRISDSSVSFCLSFIKYFTIFIYYKVFLKEDKTDWKKKSFFFGLDISAHSQLCRKISMLYIFYFRPSIQYFWLDRNTKMLMVFVFSFSRKSIFYANLALSALAEEQTISMSAPPPKR